MGELRRRDLDELGDFVLARLDEDEQRFADGVLPNLDDAERHGRIRIMRTDDGSGLLVSADPVEAREERASVPFPEKALYVSATGATRRSSAWSRPCTTRTRPGGRSGELSDVLVAEQAGTNCHWSRSAWRTAT